MKLYELRPKPCVHDRDGHPHRTAREMWQCLTENGVPGFVVTKLP